jgi:hypothetical protein
MHEFDELFFEDFRVVAYELLEPTGVTGLDLQELLTQEQLAGIIFTLTFGLIGRNWAHQSPLEAAQGSHAYCEALPDASRSLQYFHSQR